MIRRPWLVFDNLNSGDLEDIPQYGNVHIIDDSVAADGSGGPKYITVIDLTNLGGTISTIADLLGASTQWIEFGGGGGTFTAYSFIATAAQTSFPCTYSSGSVEVMSEGVAVPSTMYDDTSGTAIVFNEPRDEGAWVRIVTDEGLSGTTTPWSNVSATPTTVAGYGIVDAMPAAGATSMITTGTITTGTWEATPIDDAYIAGAANWVDSDISAVASSVKIDNMVRVTQAVYDAIGAPDPAIMYVIVG